jgi:triacylglycerol esterase/lipase EstA (alpha/beta hydrolase family)
MADAILPPGFLLQMLEGRAGVEAGQLFLQLPLLRLQAPRGSGQPILVLPGFMADDGSTFVLRQFLNNIGYAAHPWKLGVNRRRMLDFLPQVHHRIALLHAEYQQPVTLVGWSRGGILARECARDAPDMIRQVITIGSPVKGGTSASSIGSWVRRETGMTPEAMHNVLRDRQKTNITVPIRSIYSRLDGVVAWRACIDDVNPDVEHFEIRGTHMGMGTNVEVFRLLGKLLSRDLVASPEQ